MRSVRPCVPPSTPAGRRTTARPDGLPVRASNTLALWPSAKDQKGRSIRAGRLRLDRRPAHCPPSRHCRHPEVKQVSDHRVVAVLASAGAEISSRSLHRRWSKGTRAATWDFAEVGMALKRCFGVDMVSLDIGSLRPEPSAVERRTRGLASSDAATPSSLPHDLTGMAPRASALASPAPGSCCPESRGQAP